MNIYCLFNLVYRPFSCTFLFVLTILFDLKMPLLVFRRSRAVLQKRNNLSWFDLSARLTTEGKLNLYLRFAPLPELRSYPCETPTKELMKFAIINSFDYTGGPREIGLGILILIWKSKMKRRKNKIKLYFCLASLPMYHINRCARNLVLSTLSLFYRLQ